MKKIIAILFVIFLTSTQVYAQESNNNEDYKIEKRYKWYKKEYKEVGYRQKLSDTTRYFQNLTDYKESYSDYKKYNNEEVDDNYVIEEKYEYYKAKKVKFLVIKYNAKHYNQTVKDVNIKIPELILKNNNGEKINYEVYDFLSCAMVSLPYLNDGNINTDEKAEILPGGVLTLELDDYYDVDDINIDIYINSNISNSIGATKHLYFYLCPTSNEHYKTYSEVEYNFTHIYTPNSYDSVLVNLKVDDSWNNTFEYDLIDFYDEIDENNISLTSYYKKQKYYRKVTKYYKTYFVTRKYLDGYYSYVDGYFKDENDYIICYIYNNIIKEIEKISDGIITSNNITSDDIILDNNKPNKVIKPLLKVYTNNNKLVDDTITNNNSDEKIIYKYRTKYKTKYKYINYITILSFILNIFLISFIIYKKIKKKI